MGCRPAAGNRPPEPPRPRAGRRALGLALALGAVAACATAPDPAKTQELTAAEQAAVSEALIPLLTTAGLWQASSPGCPIKFEPVDTEGVDVELTPHAPCRVRLELGRAALGLDRDSLRALLAHELAHLQLGHPDTRLAREKSREETQKNVRTARKAASKGLGLIPGVGGLIGKGVGAAGKAADAAAALAAHAYLPEEERAADALAGTLLDAAGPGGCRALTALLEARLRAPDDAAWTPWTTEHPVDAGRVEAFAGACKEVARS